MINMSNLILRNDSIQITEFDYLLINVIEPNQQYLQFL